MKIFIDTAKLGEIKEAITWGIVDGVTTNPSLLREAIDEEKGKGRDIDLEDHVREICKVAGKGRPVSLEVLSQKASEIIEEARILYEKFNPIAGNAVIKIPINTYTGPGVSDYEGLIAIKESSEKKIPINATLVMTSEQALLAAKAGATYVSPFAGRVDDYIRENLGIDFGKYDYFDFSLLERIAEKMIDERLESSGDTVSAYLKGRGEAERWLSKGSRSGVEVVKQVVTILRKYGYETQVIAASMRNPRQVREVAEAGADIATIPFEVLQAMLKHPKTEEGVKRFYADATRAKYEELFKD
jgi:transaldolase